eukprot:1159245-Pelagomonas_calceolata.AAC.12
MDWTRGLQSVVQQVSAEGQCWSVYKNGRAVDKCKNEGHSLVHAQQPLKRFLLQHGLTCSTG